MSELRTRTREADLTDLLIRPAAMGDDEAIWRVLEPTIRAGETYTLPRDMGKQDALAYWRTPGNAVFVAEADGEAVGTYYLRANRMGAGSHVANCGYMTAPWHSGRGVARAMCRHSLEYAKSHGFRAMQFNFVVSANERAVRLWESLGFSIAGRLPDAFDHPKLGPVEALVMYRRL